MANNKKKVYCFVQVPPPIHGASIMNLSILNSKKINSLFEIKYLNIATANKINDIGKLEFNKFISAIRCYFIAFKNIIRFKPDICYLTITPTGLGFYKDSIFVLIAKALNIELLLHLHGRGIRNTIENGTYLTRLYYHFIFNQTNVIVLSRSLKNDLYPKWNLKSVFVLPNGIVPPVNLNGQKKVNKKITLLFLSNLVIEKGILEFIDICNFLAKDNLNFNAFIIGKEFDINEEQIKKILSEQKLQNRVHFLGPLYGDEKNNILQQCDILVFPTKYKNEAFPLVILEALCFGIIPISTKIGGIPDIITSEDIGFIVNQGRISDFVEIIKKIATDPSLLDKMKKNCKNEFYDNYTIDIFESNFANILETTLKI